MFCIRDGKDILKHVERLHLPGAPVVDPGRSYNLGCVPTLRSVVLWLTPVNCGVLTCRMWQCDFYDISGGKLKFVHL